MRKSLLGGILMLSGCASLPSGESVVGNVVTACNYYMTTAAVVKLAAWVRPEIALTVYAITDKVDPICTAILAGQAAPAGVDAVWIQQQTVNLERAETGEKSHKIAAR